MPDILANTATTSSVGVTDVFAGMLNLANDPDWWRLSTTAGMTYTFPVNNGTGHDAAVADRNAAEAVVSRLVVDGDSLSLTATKAETYFLGVEDGGAMASAATLATAPSLNGAIGTALTSVIELTGTDAAEVLEGGDEDNIIDGRGGQDTLYGNGGNDTLLGSTEDDTLIGGDGFDIADYSAVAAEIDVWFAATVDEYSLAYGTTFQGTSFQVTLLEIEGLITGSGDDTLITGNTANLVDGGGGNDRIAGGDGNDTLCGGHGNDSILGDDGEDTLIFASGGGRTVTLNSFTFQLTGEGRDVIIGIEHVIATNRNDTILGNEVANRLEGRDGDDALAGGAGNDTLIGGYGNDTIAGGADEDTLLFANSTAARSVNLSLTGAQATGEGRDVITGMEHVIGGQGNDFVVGNAGANRLDGMGGNDVLVGGAGRDTLLGGFGDDNLDGSTGVDLLIVGGIADTFIDLARTTAYQTGQGKDRVVGVENVLGGQGNDRYFGDGGANQLFGGAGRDHLDGRYGHDLLLGGAGNDTLRGGAGNDRFVFDKGDGVDSIVDFRDVDDVIIIRSGAETYADLDIRQAGANVTIGYGGDLIILDNTQRSMIDASDFMFT